MGRLFWKFFLSFWLILLLTGAGIGTAVWIHKSENGLDRLLLSGEEVAEDIRTAAAILESEGEEGLRTFLAGAREGFAPPLRALDEEGREWLGRSLSPETVAYAKALADEDSSDAPTVRRVTLPDGRRLLLFVPREAFPGHRRPRRGPKGPPPAPWIPIGSAVLASIAVSALLAWNVAKPLRHLRRAFDKAAEGKLETRIQPLIGGRRDELADLCRDFDRMAQRLQALLNAQHRLFHDVSHELRSPLARIQAAVGLARQTPAKMPESLERVEREAGRMDELVGELLTLARLESGVTGNMDEDIDLLTLLDDLVADARFEAEANGCRIQFRGAGAFFLKGQAELIFRAVENVVRNAIRHSPPGGTITIAALAGESGTDALIQVIDEGSGVAESELADIFAPFFRGQTQRSAGKKGYGMGLAIARRAVEAHGGTITAQNLFGRGFRIEIRLPAVIAREEAGGPDAPGRADR